MFWLFWIHMDEKVDECPLFIYIVMVVGFWTRWRFKFPNFVKVANGQTFDKEAWTFMDGLGFDVGDGLNLWKGVKEEFIRCVHG
jgi:hypothetical protein